MSDRTRKLVEALLKAPALLDLLKRDPERLAEVLGVGETELSAIKTGTQLLSNLLNRFSEQSPGAKPAEIAASSIDAAIPAGSRLVSNSERAAMSLNGDSSVALVGVVSLAAIAGSLALLGTVSIVAISRPD